MTARFTADSPEILMTARRFTADPPLASADTWVGRRIEGTATMPARYAYPGEPLDNIFHSNMARRDQAAKEYGEPETPHEFYAGRPGSQAERIVLDCLRELRDIPEADRLYAHELTDAICTIYLDLAWRAPPQRDDAAKIRRRTTALWELFRSSMEEKA